MNNKNDSLAAGDPKKSLIVAIQQVASLLRKEVKTATTLKMKQKQAKILSLKTVGPAMHNNIEQVAKLLRKQTLKSSRRGQKQ